MKYCGNSVIIEGELLFEHICDDYGTLCGLPRCNIQSEYLVNGSSTTCEKCKQIYKMITAL